MSQALVLSIKLATVSSITYFGVSTVIMFSHGYLPQLVEVEIWTLAWKRWTFYLANKTCKQQFYFSCCRTLLTAAVSHEVKSSNYQCQNFNHQTYYSSPYWNHIWQSRFVLPLCQIIQIFLRKYIWQSTSFQKVATLNTATSLTVNSIMDIFL